MTVPSTTEVSGQTGTDIGSEPTLGPSRSAIAVALDFVGGTLPQIGQLLNRLGLSPGGPGLPGSLFQWTRSTLDGVRMVEVWQTLRHFEYFLAKDILPAIEQTGLPEPQVTIYDVHRYTTQGPSVVIDIDAEDDPEAS